MDRSWHDIQLLSSRMMNVLESLKVGDNSGDNSGENQDSCREGNGLPGGKILQSHWQIFTELESEWSQLIHKTVRAMKQKPNFEEMRQRLTEMMNLNRQLLTSSQSIKNEIGLTLSKIDRQKKAALTYQKLQKNI